VKTIDPSVLPEDITEENVEAEIPFSLEDLENDDDKNSGL
jgi:hypothetical protein